MSQAGVILNPNLTTVAGGSFNVDSEGLIQGTAFDDPAVRNYLAGGLVGPNEAYPMWGGIAISESSTPVSTAAGTPAKELGGYITRATAVGNITGFTVYNQGHNAITTPQSPAPLFPQGGSINFFRLGSAARIAVAMDPALIDDAGDIITTQFSWDFFNQQLIAYAAAYAGAAATAETYTSSTGIFEVTFAAAPGPVAGDWVQISGASVAALNGSFEIVTTASGGTILNLQAEPGLGVLTPTGSSLVAGGGAVPVRVLNFSQDNCMTVDYDFLTGFNTWNRNGACAVILI